jgi:hypothetical protein
VRAGAGIDDAGEIADEARGLGRYVLIHA